MARCKKALMQYNPPPPHRASAAVVPHFPGMGSWIIISMYLLSGATITSSFLDRSRIIWSSLLPPISWSTFLAFIARDWKRAAYCTDNSRDASVKLCRIAIPSWFKMRNPRTPGFELMRFTSSSISGPVEAIYARNTIQTSTFFDDSAPQHGGCEIIFRVQNEAPTGDACTSACMYKCSCTDVFQWLELQRDTHAPKSKQTSMKHPQLIKIEAIMRRERERGSGSARILFWSCKNSLTYQSEANIALPCSSLQNRNMDMRGEGSIWVSGRLLLWSFALPPHRLS